MEGGVGLALTRRTGAALPGFEESKPQPFSPWTQAPMCLSLPPTEPAQTPVKPTPPPGDKPAPTPAGKPPTDQERVDETLKAVPKSLEGSAGKPVTADGAKGALDTLRGLPPALPGRAVEGLSMEDLSKLLTTVSIQDRELFETLYRDTQDLVQTDALPGR